MTARVFAQDAEPIADRFIEHVMPQTFLADLVAAIGQFEQAMHQRQAGKEGRSVARARIREALTSGGAAARALDAMVGNRLRDDPVTMAVWKGDRRVQYPASRARTVVDAPASETVPPAAAGGASAQGPAASGVTSTAEAAS